jgi:hypothetical protein
MRPNPFAPRPIAIAACLLIAFFAQLPAVAREQQRNNEEQAAPPKQVQERKDADHPVTATAADGKQPAEEMRSGRCGTWVIGLVCVSPFLALGLIVVSIVVFNVTLWVQTLRPGR